MLEKSHRQPQLTLQLVYEYCVLFVESMFTFLYAASTIEKCERAIRFAYPPFFSKLRSLSNSTNKNLS
jgi:hypothetical protein